MSSTVRDARWSCSRSAPCCPRAQSSVALLGRHSLLLYAVHIPFCYGRFGKPLRSQLDLAQASLAFAVLVVGALLLAGALETSSTRQAVRRPAL
jgi:fucose 4-O-acetylase-like acetyltransferase